jgi:hypothetical protein
MMYFAIVSAYYEDPRILSVAMYSVTEDPCRTPPCMHADGKFRTNGVYYDHIDPFQTFGMVSVST